MADGNQLLEGITIVLADDSQTIRHTVEAVLGAAGCRVVSAEDGFDVLAMVVDEMPHLVLLDINMPRLDGYQACALIKQSDRCGHIPVVLLSAQNSVFDRARGKVVRADNYLVKPFSRDELIEVVRCLTKKSQSGVDGVM